MVHAGSETEYLSRLRALWSKAWPNDVPNEPYYPHGEMPLCEYLRAWARSQPNKAAVIFYGSVLTFAGLDDQSDRFAAQLVETGVTKGDRVAVFMPNCPQLHIVFFGILKLGAIYVPVSPLSRTSELSYQLNDTGAEIIVVLDLLLETVRAVRHETKLRRVFFTGLAEVLPDHPSIPVPNSVKYASVRTDDATDLLPALAAMGPVSPPAAPDLDDIAAINYTGGTTGMPKGCVHTHRNMVSVAAANYGTGLYIDEKSVFLVFMPEFWISGENMGLIFPVFCGCSVVLLARWSPESFLAGVSTYKATITAMTADNAVELMDRADFTEFDLSSLRQIRVASFVKKLDLNIRRRWKSLTGSTLAESAWGMTETHTSTTFVAGFQEDDLDLKSRPIFIGVPVPGNEVKITDFDTGQLVPLGAEGELRVRSPAMMKGYWNKPEETEQSLGDGWLRTGDLGLIDELGFLHFLGRRKEMLKVKGMSVFPPEIEALMAQHPAVLGSGVVGREDRERGQVPIAFVQLKPEFKDRVTASELEEWCRNQLAAYKTPEVKIVDALPMTATGKVRKTDLSVELWLSL